MGVAVLLLLLAGAVVTLTSGIDPNRYRPKIEAIVGDLTGMPLKIEGNLRIEWFPWLRLQVGAARLGAKTAAGETAANPGAPLIEWRSAQVGARLLPLLKGDFVVDRVVLEGPRIHLRRDAQGRGNWETLAEHLTRAGPPATDTLAEAQATDTPAVSAGRAPPQIAGIEIRDGALDYADDMSGIHLSLSDWQFRMGAWTPGATFPLHTSLLARGDSLPEAGLAVQLDTPKLTLVTTPLSVTAPEYSLQVADVQVKGKLSFAQTPDPGALSHFRAGGSATVMAPSVRRLAADFVPDTSLPLDPATLGRLELTSDWTFTGGALAVRPLTMRLDGVTFTGWMERSAPPDSEWTFELHGDRIDLGRYMALEQRPRKKPFELPMEAFRSLRANGSLTFAQAQWADARMKDIRLRLQTAERPP